MGFFGWLMGWDQSMGALNAVLASYLIEKASRKDRQEIAKEVFNIITSVRHGQSLDAILNEISKESRVVQMNFIALACDNLGIDPPVPNNVWTRVKNPYQIGFQVDAIRISAAIQAIEKQDGVQITWPGNDARIDFKQMYQQGILLKDHINARDDVEQVLAVQLNRESRNYQITHVEDQISGYEVIFTGTEDDCRNLVSYAIAGVDLARNPVLRKALSEATSEADLQRGQVETEILSPDSHDRSGPKEWRGPFRDVPYARTNLEAERYRLLLTRGYKFSGVAGAVVATSPSGASRNIRDSKDLADLVRLAGN